MLIKHLQLLALSILFFISPFTAPFGIFFIGWLIVSFIIFAAKFKKSCYSVISENSLWKVYFDKGLYGEFLTVQALEGISPNEKIMTNLYLNKKGTTDQTTEIDVLYLNEYGVFVIESKNYSGWIFGNERDEKWTQSLNARTKNRFYNPIKQNYGHIAALSYALGTAYGNTYRSLIVFSERCQLKKITVTSPNVWVIKRNSLRKTICGMMSGTPVLSPSLLENAGQILSAYTHMSSATKQAHIDQIRSRIQN